jgi:hypothetical protein
MKKEITKIHTIYKWIARNRDEIARLEKENAIFIAMAKEMEKIEAKSAQSGNTSEEEVGELVDKGDYPFKEKANKKIAYVIRVLIGRVCKIQDVKSEISKLEGSEDADIFNSFSYHLKNMITDGELFINRVGGSNKYTFYAVPEFFDHGFHLKPECEPAEGVLGKDSDKRTIKPNEWEEQKNMK